MNSHDAGVNYALMDQTARNQLQTRANWIADIADAMENGFKAEPDLAPHHLPLLSDEALDRVFKESEQWRDKHRERELEDQLNDAMQRLALSERCYDDLRTILGAQKVPGDFSWVGGNDGKDRYVKWTEHKARGLVAEAHLTAKYAEVAKSAEHRNALVERYVTACDRKRVPYNWNIFNMSTDALRRYAETIENMERLTRCDIDGQRVTWFEERTHQETEQNLRKAHENIDTARNLIAQYSNGRISGGVASQLLEALAGGGVWIHCLTCDKPDDLKCKELVEVEFQTGTRKVLLAGNVEWNKASKFRRVKH